MLFKIFGGTITTGTFPVAFGLARTTAVATGTERHLAAGTGHQIRLRTELLRIHNGRQEGSHTKERARDDVNRLDNRMPGVVGQARQE